MTFGRVLDGRRVGRKRGGPRHEGVLTDRGVAIEINSITLAVFFQRIFSTLLASFACVVVSFLVPTLRFQERFQIILNFFLIASLPFPLSSTVRPPPPIHIRLSSPPPKSVLTLQDVEARVLKSVENRDNIINGVVSELKTRHEKIKVR